MLLGTEHGHDRRCIFRTATQDGYMETSKPTSPVVKVAGAILAGGHARRLGGIPKGTIRAGGRLSFIEHLIAHMVRASLPEMVIAANDECPYAHLGCVIVPDKRVNAGPLAGIEAALGHFAGRYDAVLCLPCDLPALSAREISALIVAFAAADRPVVFAETGDSARHPLCAVIRTDMLAGISAALDRGTFAVGEVWLHLGGTAVHFDNSQAFININSPDDVEAWSARQSRSSRRGDSNRQNRPL